VSLLTIPARDTLRATILTIIAGIADAVGYITMGGVFAANMTGNVVLLGFGASGAGHLAIVASLVALAGFLVGARGGGRLAKARRDEEPPRTALAIQWAALGLALLLAGLTQPGTHETSRYIVLAILGLAMGVQNAAVREMAVPGVATTVLTLTLTRIAADWRRVRGTNQEMPRQLGSVIVMFVGAVIGGLLERIGLFWPLLGAFVVMSGAWALMGTARPSAPAAQTVG